MIYLILIDLGISTLIFTPLTHFTYLFSISFGISLSHGILKSQRLRNSILPINNTGNIDPNGSYIEAKVLSTFLFCQTLAICRYKRCKRFNSGNVAFSDCVSLFIPIQSQYFSFIRFCSKVFFCKTSV